MTSYASPVRLIWPKMAHSDGKSQTIRKEAGGSLLRNTVWLYLRMAVLTVVQLAVTRLLLHAFGVDDYGLWTLAYALVLIWSFPADIAGEVTLRWLSVGIGRGLSEHERAALFCRLRGRSHWLIAGAAGVCLGVCLWWMSAVASIPEASLPAARTLVAVLTLMMAVKCLSVQYMSWLVSAERFRSYAWLSMLEGVAILACAAALCLLPSTASMALYAWALVVVECIVLLFYRHVCQIPSPTADGASSPAAVSGSGRYLMWNVIGGLTVMLWLQAMTPVINLGHGLAVTAASGIAMLLLAKVRGFCAGFERAVVPRLMRLHAAGEMGAVRQLMCRYSALCFLGSGVLLAALALTSPLWLQWWLGEIPEGCLAMVRIALCAAWLCSIDVPLNAVVMARGRIRVYECVMGVCFLAAPVAVYAASLFGLDAIDAFAWQLLPVGVALPIRMMFALRATRRG